MYVVVCMCVCIYVCLYVRTYVRVYVYTDVCLCLMYVCVYVYVCIYVRVCMYAFVLACVWRVFAQKSPRNRPS